MRSKIIYDSSDSTSSLSGYSSDGRLFLYEYVPTVINIAGLHLERLEKVRGSYDNVKGLFFGDVIYEYFLLHSY